MDVAQHDSEWEPAASVCSGRGMGATTDGDGGEVLAGEDELFAGDARDRGASISERAALAAARNL